jgi:hypothetical protein
MSHTRHAPFIRLVCDSSIVDRNVSSSLILTHRNGQDARELFYTRPYSIILFLFQYLNKYRISQVVLYFGFEKINHDAPKTIQAQSLNISLHGLEVGEGGIGNLHPLHTAPNNRMLII